ncbi:hypothetical protein IMCC1989_2177 [gamma proteobacterium IMCC1989]|nr:hypothetical protein IMCC1989_2177 [gamma proteobacterium IMCC1989]
MDTTKKAEFIRLFKAIKPERHRHEVWSDFVTTSAIALHNAIAKDDTLENEYLKIISVYSTCDLQRLCEMLSIVVMLLEPEPTDILGQLYMELELSSKENGQYFTPPYISGLMAEILHGESLDQKLQQPFVTLHEPACGAGGMVMSFVKVVIQKKHNPAEKLWVSAIDINRIAALMAYIQFSLWNVPAEVIVGNALSMELRERWLTPAHYLYDWDTRLRWQKMTEGMSELLEIDKNDEVNTSEEKILEEPAPTVESKTGSQASFDFDLSTK